MASENARRLNALYFLILVSYFNFSPQSLDFFEFSIIIKHLSKQSSQYILRRETKTPHLQFLDKKMGQIDFTNIIIDDFRKGKTNPWNRYIYILTHIHSDHLRGLTNSWNYGPIYCSQVTANLILNKFPKLATYVKVLGLEESCRIVLAENTVATVTFFDANHCAGSVMVLLQGYFGRYLYTGDFRFDRKKFASYTYLYPAQSTNQRFQGCSRQIDKLWLDNTFCHPRFHFLPFDQALPLVSSFIRSHPSKKIFIGMDYYGKEEILIQVARELDLIIVVDQQRYENIIAMEFDREIFSTNPEEGRLEIVQKTKLYQKLDEFPEAIGLVMSGWALKEEWRKFRDVDRVYYIPYSLHSNYEEMVNFVKSIKPSFIDPIVNTIESGSEGSGPTSKESGYNTDGNAEAFNDIVKRYTSPVSENYRKNLQDKQFQQILKKRFALDRKPAEINKTQLGLNTIQLPARGRGGYKLKAQRDEQQIRRVKEQIKKSRQIRNYTKKQLQEVVINSDSQGDDSSQIRFVDREEIQNLMKIQKEQKEIKQDKENENENSNENENENEIENENEEENKGGDLLVLDQNKMDEEQREQVNQMMQEKKYVVVEKYHIRQNIPNLDWKTINKIQLLQGEKNIYANFVQKVAKMLPSHP